MVMIRFMIEGVIELGMASLICAKSVSKANFEAFWEGFSTSCAFVVIMICLLTPIYLIVAKKRYLQDIKQDIEDPKDIDLFTGLKENSSSALCYSIVFLVRRYCLVILIVLFPAMATLKSFVHIHLCLVQFVFVLSVKPFDSNLRNKQEIFNELAVTVASYHLLYFT